MNKPINALQYNQRHPQVHHGKIGSRNSQNSVEEVTSNGDNPDPNVQAILQKLEELDS
jgi:hypothetical protein